LTGEFTESASKLIVKQIVDALVYLKNEGLSYNDIRPENIILSKINNKYIVKLIDYGKVELFDPKSNTFYSTGTTHYSSP